MDRERSLVKGNGAAEVRRLKRRKVVPISPAGFAQNGHVSQALIGIQPYSQKQQAANTSVARRATLNDKSALCLRALKPSGKLSAPASDLDAFLESGR